MANINLTRVVLGGLVAGVVINLFEVLNAFLTGDAMEARAAELGLDPMGPGQIAVLVASCFVAGIFIVWLYAAVRPRLGAGLNTALIVGFVVWVLAGLWSIVVFVTTGLFPLNGPLVLGTIVALVEFLAATAAGAWVYKES